MMLNFEVFNVTALFVIAILQLTTRDFLKRYSGERIQRGRWIHLEHLIGLIAGFFVPMIMGFFATLWLSRIFAMLKKGLSNKGLNIGLRILRGIGTFFSLLFITIIILYIIIGVIGRVVGLDPWYPLLTVLGLIFSIIFIKYSKGLFPDTPIYQIPFLSGLKTQRTPTEKIDQHSKNIKFQSVIILIIIIVLPFLSVLNTSLSILVSTEKPATFDYSLQIMTFNILQEYADEDDPLNEWPARRVPLAAYIKSQDVDFFGVQEARIGQLQYLNTTVDNRNYNWTGRGRDDGVEEGEFAAIFYDMDKFELLDSGTFWFTDTPDIPSRQPGDHKRICSWGHFQDKSTLNEFFIYCTHYGFMPWAQIIASMMINNHVAANTANLPVVVMGDFNMPNLYPFYLYMEGWGQKPLYEAYRMKHGYVNPFGATSLLTWDINFQIGFHIDYFFVSTNVYVESCNVLRDSYDGIRTYSDHQPVLLNCWFE